MIGDLTLGGVLVPGLLVRAVAALAGTVAVIRLLTFAGLLRLFVPRAVAELATFAILYGLLVECLPYIGSFQ